MNLGETRDFLLARVVWSPSEPRDNGRAPESRAEQAGSAPRRRLHRRIARRAARGRSAMDQRQRRAEVSYRRQSSSSGPANAPDSATSISTTSTASWRSSLPAAIGKWKTIEGIDEARRRVLFTSTEDSPTERQFYAVGLDGSNKQRLTQGAGTHSISLAPNAGLLCGRLQQPEQPAARERSINPTAPQAAPVSSTPNTSRPTSSRSFLPRSSR